MFCRVCLKSANDGFGIFNDKGLKLKVAEILIKHLFFHPKIDDPISTCICQQCWLTVQSFHEFYVRLEIEHKTYFEQCIKKNEQNPGDRIVLKNNGVEMEIVEETDQADHERVAADPLLALETVKTEAENEHICEDSEATDPLAGDSTNRSDEMSDKMEEQDDDDSSDINLADLRNKKPKKTKAKAKTENPKKAQRKKPTINSAERNEQFDQLVRDHVKLICDVCQLESSTLVQLLEHKRLEHAQEEPFFFCCKHNYYKRYHLIEHIRAKHFSNPGKECPVCHKQVRHLQRHMMGVHATEEELKFVCDKCERRFVKSYLLKRHKVRECKKGERNILCERCHNKFANMYLLRRHMIVHQVAGDAVPWETYSCNKCPKVFSYSYQLREHMSVHGEAPHKCETCKRGFSRSESLAVHIRRKHSAEAIAKAEKKLKAKQMKKKVIS